MDSSEAGNYGVSRLLELVRGHFFTRNALFRVVPNFLTQFGIAASPQIHQQWRDAGSIPDDTPSQRGLRRGQVSFAGSGPNSRGTEMFVVTGRQAGIGYQPWETPIAQIPERDMESVVDKFYSAGDVPPWGNGPSQTRMYAEGNACLSRDFSALDYIEWCRLLPDDQRWLSSAATDALLSQHHADPLPLHRPGEVWATLPPAALYGALLLLVVVALALLQWLRRRRLRKAG